MSDDVQYSIGDAQKASAAISSFPNIEVLATWYSIFRQHVSVNVLYKCSWRPHFRFGQDLKLDLMTMWRFLPAAFMFYMSLFTNSELLLHANVDTFIVSVQQLQFLLGGVMHQQRYLAEEK
ncbi:hypothetical protein POM88_011908 [Heracleum sosnowskyi]|uniref:Uncharacterized protein n=1 Tax=Heracleum sosnowskyi TaxID=360622 RepID=A0AAD8N201_9APIA|nr:hypothetical protein POM88_011908 [Heracleum sosnowskyi]